MSKKEINGLITYMVDLIEEEQLENGSFSSLSVPHTPSKPTKVSHTTFHTSLITSCLLSYIQRYHPGHNAVANANIDEHISVKISAICKKGLDFIQKEKSSNWSWNYWQHQSLEHGNIACPDDLDDTFCALACLERSRRELIGGETMANITKILLSCETQIGGPYKTWIIPKNNTAVHSDLASKWYDIDLAVNSNVAYFLSLRDISIPNIDCLIEDAIENNAFGSKYYFSKYTVLYFISRWYRGQKTMSAMNILINDQRPDGSWRCGYDHKDNDPLLDTALAVSTILNFYKAISHKPYEENRSLDTTAAQSIRLALENGRQYLLSKLNFHFRNSTHPICPLYIERIICKEKYCSVSSATVFAFCVETLGFIKECLLDTKPTKVNSANDHSEIFFRSVKKKTIKHMAKLDQKTDSCRLDILQDTLRVDTDKQITLLPYFFHLSLRPELALKINTETVTQLCQANITGWMAYRIFDDILDNDHIKDIHLCNNDSDDSNIKIKKINSFVESLPTAMILLRETIDIYSKILKNHRQQDFLNNIMDKMDNANAWEQKNCRVRGATRIDQIIMPNYTDHMMVVGEKSLGHALGPATMLILLGYSADSPEVENILSFFLHYLIARQLNDDTHDWLADLKKGIFNPANACTLQIWLDFGRQTKNLSTPSIYNKNAYASKKYLDAIEENKKELQKIFWTKTMGYMAGLIFDHVKQARNALDKMQNIIADQRYFLKILDKPKTAAQKGLTESAEMMEFLKIY